MLLQGIGNVAVAATVFANVGKRLDPICISGVYPHLAAFNKPEAGQTRGSGGNECGIGAVVPWAGKLWFLTYSPHCPRGSEDKLYAVTPNLSLEILPESVGGTPAGRLIHRESAQLFMGPYAIDGEGRVRVIPYERMPGRHTAIARHLVSPESLVYYLDMEGTLYEVNVRTLEVKRLFHQPVPGCHAKGGYTGQGRFIMSNNGESKRHSPDPSKLLAGGPPQTEDEVGVLAEWDDASWRVVERKQFTDVTGPGGIEGADSEESSVWAVGWDKRSVILMLLDRGKWTRFRLPKGSHTCDGKHGWFTEWPRIREVFPGRWMMDMHALFWEFPATFSLKNRAGLRPMGTHHRYIPDFCHWNGKVVLATDETSIMQNPLAGQSQSNLWFGDFEELYQWGPRAGWGGPWLKDEVKPDQPSDPITIAGFEGRCLHLAVGESNEAGDVTFTLEVDIKGKGRWKTYKTVSLPFGGYAFFLLPEDLKAEWMRLASDRSCQATAYLHFSEPGRQLPRRDPLFRGLASLNDKNAMGGLVRPARHNRRLQFLARRWEDGTVVERYLEVDEQMHFHQAEDRSEEMKRIAETSLEFETDEASVILTWQGKRYRLPKGPVTYDQPFPTGVPRGIRECESERNLMNCHGTFYELPREQGIPRMKPVATHGRQILDFCTWRGLWVISGTKPHVTGDEHLFGTETGETLWFGAIDDLWKLGKPVGEGGPWKNSPVQADEPSDPYLMTQYDRKRVELSHDLAKKVEFALEVDFDHHGWHLLTTLPVPPQETVTHEFPRGFGAHWVRLKTDHPCKATAWFVYE